MIEYTKHNVLVLGCTELMTLIATALARNNAVTYITHEKELYEDYMNKINDFNFGGDDVGILCENVNDYINKLQDLKDMKFDKVIMNPPYGDKTNKDKKLHHTITKEALNYSDNVISLMPDKLIYSTSSRFNSDKKVYVNRINSVITCDPNIFNGTFMLTIGIYTFIKQREGKITLVSLQGEERQIDSLFDLKLFTDYEYSCLKYLYTSKPNYNAYRTIGINKRDNVCQFVDNYTKRFNDNSYFVFSNLANGNLNAKFISKRSRIVDGKTNLKENLTTDGSACRVISEFNNRIAAEHYFAAIQRPLLRFTLYKLQDDQNMTERVYQYVPLIDWSDDKSLSDAGILQMCGCPEQEAIEFAEYCRKQMESFDNKHNKNK